MAVKSNAFFAMLGAAGFLLVALGLVVGLLAGYAMWGGKPAATAVALVPTMQGTAQTPAAPTAAPTAEHVNYKIETAGFPSTGPANAPITIVEFSDYQCPYCARFHAETYRALLDSYPDKIRFIYRNFPLPFHQNAVPGAQAALCAGEQNAYWQYHDKLFAEQSVMNNTAGTVVDTVTYTQWAKDLGLDATAFQTCLTSEKYKQQVQADLAYATTLPTENGEPAVGGTPTFFINGVRVVGAVPLEYFKMIIDAQLGK